MIKSVFTFVLTLTVGAVAFSDKDRGAGHGYQGRPLESYVKDITQFAEFQNIVLPAIEKLRKKVPAFAEDLMQVATRKNWFFVPVRLPEIPAERVGVAFKIDQYALQSYGEIWFDAGFYKDMEKDQYRAMILAHELVMGIKLNTLYKGNSHCSTTNRSYACELSERDYVAIRDLGLILLEKQDKYTDAQITTFLNENNFGRYTTDTDLLHLATYGTDKLYNLLMSEQRTQLLPTKGRDNLGMGCAFEFRMSNDQSALEVKIHRTNSGGAIMRDYLPLRVVVQSAPAIVVKNATASFQYATPVATPMFGSYRRKLEIYITPEKITRIAAHWETYVFDYRTGANIWSKVDTGPQGNFEPAQRICE